MWEQSVAILNPAEALKEAQESPAKDTNVLTDADRIRAMSDEELAASNYIPCPYADDCCGECKYGWHEQAQTCEECKLEWLKQPAEDKI